MRAREGYVDFRGHRTWFRFVGDLNSAVTPLLALHGGPGSTHNYFTPLEGLATERPVVFYDQIGCGKSDRPQDIEWNLDVFLEELLAVRDQLGLERIHLLGTSWGGMLAQEHVLSGADGIVSLTLSSTLANLALWNDEQLKLRAALPAGVVAVLDLHEQAGTYDDPEYEQAMQVYMDRHFYRGPQPRAELEAMGKGRAPDVYRAMQGPNEWTTTGALKGWELARAAARDRRTHPGRARPARHVHRPDRRRARPRHSGRARGRLGAKLAHAGARRDGPLPRSRRRLPRGSGAGAAVVAARWGREDKNLAVHRAVWHRGTQPPRTGCCSRDLKPAAIHSNRAVECGRVFHAQTPNRVNPQRPTGQIWDSSPEPSVSESAATPSHAQRLATILRFARPVSNPVTRVPASPHMRAACVSGGGRIRTSVG